MTAGRLVDVTTPRLSDSMEEDTVLRWLMQPGDAVAKGEPLVEVETHKATVVYGAEQDGVLSEITVGESDSATHGAVIVRLAVGGAAHGAAISGLRLADPYSPTLEDAFLPERIVREILSRP